METTRRFVLAAFVLLTQIAVAYTLLRMATKVDGIGAPE